jgi:predicted phosphodiesterase
MRVLLLSDIHANLEAFRSVLDDAGTVDRVWFLGDVVGYGPEPEACVKLLRSLEPEHCLAGNHDWAAVGRMDASEFNPEARKAAMWTASAHSRPSRAWLASLEPRLDLDGGEVTLVHGSPRRPVWEYILDAAVAMEALGDLEAPLGLFGHTHVPVAYEEGVDGALRWPVTYAEPLDLSGGRWLANPGSVGQPRDGDPRAAYALLDPVARAISFHRVAYDIAAVKHKILAAGLPPRLAARLDYGW